MSELDEMKRQLESLQIACAEQSLRLDKIEADQQEQKRFFKMLERESEAAKQRYMSDRQSQPLYTATDAEMELAAIQDQIDATYFRGQDEEEQERLDKLMEAWNRPYILQRKPALLSLVRKIVAKPLREKKDIGEECGFSPIYGQTRAPFSIQYYLVGILFLIFDLEILLLYPVAVTLYNVSTYGFWVAMIFFTVQVYDETDPDAEVLEIAARGGEGLAALLEVSPNAQEYFTVENVDIFNRAIASAQGSSGRAELDPPNLLSELALLERIERDECSGLKSLLPSTIALRSLLLYWGKEFSGEVKRVILEDTEERYFKLRPAQLERLEVLM